MESNKRRIFLNNDVYYYPDIVLGRGAFGTVFKGTMVKKNDYAAVKKIIIPQSKHQLFLKELDIMKILKHPNIVELWDYEHKREQNQGYIVMELCESGTLQKQIERSGALPDQKCFVYLKQIVDATAYVNSKNFIHRDLKSENILITKDQILKICDFGVAKVIKPDEINQMTNGVGTPRNMAPEVIKGTDYNQQCDVWSVGMIFYELFVGRHFFRRETTLFELIDNHNKINMVGHLEVEGDYNPVFIQIIRRTIVFDPKKRITINKLKELVDTQLQIFYKKQSEREKNGGAHSLGEFPQRAKKLEKLQKLPRKNFKIVEQTKQSESDHSQQSFKLKKNWTQMERQLDIKHKSQNILAEWRLYVNYLLTRALLFIDYSRPNIPLKNSPQNKCERYILLGMSIAIFLLQNENVQSLLKQNQIKIPGQIPVLVAELSLDVRMQYQKQKETHLSSIRQLKRAFMVKIVQLANRFIGQQYKKQFKDQLLYWRNITAELNEGAKENKFKQNSGWFLKWFRKFFYQYEPLKVDNLEKLCDEYLRVYWAFVKLSNLEEQFPADKYQDTNLIGQFNDFYVKAKKQKLIADIKRMGIK